MSALTPTPQVGDTVRIDERHPFEDCAGNVGKVDEVGWWGCHVVGDGWAEYFDASWVQVLPKAGVC